MKSNLNFNGTSTPQNSTHTVRQYQAHARGTTAILCVACANTSKPPAPCPTKSKMYIASNVQPEIGAPLDDSIATTAALATLAPQPVATEVATLL